MGLTHLGSDASNQNCIVILLWLVDRKINLPSSSVTLDRELTPIIKTKIIKNFFIFLSEKYNLFEFENNNTQGVMNNTNYKIDKLIIPKTTFLDIEG